MLIVQVLAEHTVVVLVTLVVIIVDAKRLGVHAQRIGRDGSIDGGGGGRRVGGLALFGARVLEPDLQNALLKACPLAQLLEIFGIGVWVDLKVSFHRSQLLMLERSAHTFLLVTHAAGRRHCHGNRGRILVTTAATTSGS